MKIHIKLFQRYILRNIIIVLNHVFVLTIGFCFFLISLMYVKSEIDFDSNIENAERTYRVLKYFDGEYIEYSSYTPPILKGVLKQLPEVAGICRFYNFGELLISNESENYYAELCYADPEIFDIFDFEFIKGDPANAFSESHFVIITESEAIKIFKDLKDALGNILTINKKSYIISGIIKDFELKYHIDFDYLIPFQSIEDKYSSRWKDNWRVNCLSTYVIIKDGYKKSLIEDKIKQLILSSECNYCIEKKLNFILQDINEVHLFSSKIKFDANNNSKNNWTTILIYFSIGVFFLFVVCLNFLTISFTSILNRNKEISIRRIIGETKRGLTISYIIESVFFSIISMVFAILILPTIVPFFNKFLSSSLSLYYFIGDYTLIFFFFLIVLFIGITIGFIMSISHQIINRFYNNSRFKNHFNIFNIVLNLQLLISTFIIIFSVTFFIQMRFILESNLGYNYENIIEIKIKDKQVKSDIEIFKNELLIYPQISAVSLSMYGNSYGNDMFFKEKGSDKEIDIYYNSVDSSFFSLLGLQIIKGKNFENQQLNDSIIDVIVNEQTVKSFCWNSPVGKYLEPNYRVIGVVNNYNFLPLYSEDAPLLLFNSSKYFRSLLVKINSNTVNESLEIVNSKWNEIFPNKPLEYSFIEEKLHESYKQYINSKPIFLLTSLITILLSIISTIVFISNIIKKISKEIVIRIIYSASHIQIIQIIFNRFYFYIILSTIIAWLLSFISIRYWLNQFAYHINILDIFWLFASTLILNFLLFLFIIFIAIVKFKSSNYLKYIKQ